MTTFGKSIRIYLKDGTVTGIRFGEVVNQTIQSIACPRNRLAELRGYPEANRPGVYFLFGIDEETGDNKSYIGEAENVFERLQSHSTKKDFWSEVIFFASKDENLTKSHVKYLESRAIQITKTINRYKIDNENESQASSLPAADKDAMEEFLVYIKLLLGVFGHKLLEELNPVIRKLEENVHTSTLTATTEDNQVITASKTLELFLNGTSLKAKAIQTDEGIVVLKDSEAAKNTSPGLYKGYLALREKLINNGTLKLLGEKYIFQENYLFDAASPAAAVIVGHSISGPQAWRNKEGVSLKEIEEHKLLMSIQFN
jgi:hypothetical protein